MTSVKALSRLLFLCWAAGFMALAQAAEPVANVLFAVRGVEVLRADGNREAASKGTALYEGDTLLTSDSGRAQLQFVDGARTALKPNSQLAIDAYQMPPLKADGKGLVTAAEDNSAVLNLIKGGMRAVSGEITKDNPEAMSVKTPVATMGIRGTDFTAVLVPSSLTSGAWVLQVSVRDGVIRITNPFGSVDVHAGEYGVSHADTAPQLTLYRPHGLLGSDENSAEVEGYSPGNYSYVPAGGGQYVIAPNRNAPIGEPGRLPDDHPAPPPTDTAIPILPPTTIDGQNLEQPEEPQTIVPPFQRSVAVAGIRQTPNPEVVTGSAINDETQLIMADDGRAQTLTTQYSQAQPQGAGQAAILSMDNNGVDTAITADLGADQQTGFVWGRWTDGSFEASPDVSGQNTTVTLNGQQSLHWVYGADYSGDPLSNVVAIASYSLVGGTSPVDSAGNVGTLGSADLSVDFTQGDVSLDIQLSVNNTNWQAFGGGQLQNGGVLVFEGSDMSGSIDSANGPVGSVVNGQFNGSFSPNLVPLSVSESVPAGAAFSYGLYGDFNGQSEAVSGVAVVGNPSPQ